MPGIIYFPKWRRWTLEHIDDKVSKLVYEERVEGLGDKTQEAVDNTLKWCEEIKAKYPDDMTLDFSFSPIIEDACIFTSVVTGSRKNVLSTIIAEIIPDSTIGEMTFADLLLSIMTGERVTSVAYGKDKIGD